MSLNGVEETHSVGTISNVETSYFAVHTTENVLPDDNVSMSVGHLDHVMNRDAGSYQLSQSDAQQFWRQDLCRRRTTSLEQSAAQSQTMWAVIWPV